LVNRVLILLTGPVNEGIRKMKMKDSTRENLSYFGLFLKMMKVKKEITPEYVSYGSDKDQYLLYYEPQKLISDKVIIWIHGGGWNAGNPKFFDYAGQKVASEGYRMVSLGYRLSPKNKYPAQIEDVCKGYNEALRLLKDKGIPTDKLIICGPSAGAHLSSILCYSKKDQEKYNVDISGVIGYVGWGGPYSFDVPATWTLRTLLGQLLEDGYDRRDAEPVSLMGRNRVPMLIIQSRHDGVIAFECAEEFRKKADQIGNRCELYQVEDKKDTHSWYTAGLFLEDRSENKGLDKFFTWIESL
jgi:acetyl esterase/lipase